MKKGKPAFDPNNPPSHLAPPSFGEASPPSKEEIFAKLNGSSQRMLDSLIAAYEAGMKEGISDDEQDKVIELMRRAKLLRDKVKDMTSEEQPPKTID